jgi:hypothetical protein
MYSVARASCPTRAASRRWGAWGWRGVSALAAPLLASSLGCGSTEAEDAPPCELTGQCAVASVCPGGGCEGPPDASVISKPIEGSVCNMVACPLGNFACCSGAVASATGSGRVQYADRPESVRDVRYEAGVLRADFSFSAPNQQGWVTFELTDEMDLSRLDFFGHAQGVADRFLVVNTNQVDDGGCSFGFDVEPRPPPFGVGPFVPGSVVPFESNGASCYGGGRPGRANELAFAIFSNAAGNASLVITNLMLRSE